MTDEAGRFVAEHLSHTRCSIGAEPKADSPYAATLLPGGRVFGYPPAMFGEPDNRFPLTRAALWARDASMEFPPSMERRHHVEFRF